MISSNSLPRFPFATAGAHQQVPKQNQPESSPSDYSKPSYGDDDDFYIIIHACGLADNSPLREEVVKKLSKDHPGIFDGLTDPSDLLGADPVRYQPLAKLLSDSSPASVFESKRLRLGDNSHAECRSAVKISYGLYKHGFYKIMEDHTGQQSLESYPDRYEAMKKNKLNVSQLRVFLFDQSISDSDKVARLQLLFPPIGEGEEEITIEQLLENTEFLFGDTFKEAKQRAIENGFQP